MPTAQSSNLNAGINLARNSPVALVVGVSSFLGSHLAEKLLSKNIQVVGVDDFSSGSKDNLEIAIRDGNFHLINSRLDDLDLTLPRLDYLFILGGKDEGLEKLWQLAEAEKCRILLISSIELYNQDIPKELEWSKSAEVKLAKFAHSHHLNARILRLGPVFGPRMRFFKKDPMAELIHAALTNQLQKEVNLEFSTRALYVADAVELIVKAMLSGGTALKIFDGVTPSPIKLAEIKQVLLDPVWYEQRRFIPTELPPWQTPNLEKTIRHLNWRPKTDLVTALRQTLNYFRDHEVNLVDRAEAEPERNQPLPKPKIHPLTPPDLVGESAAQKKHQSFKPAKLRLSKSAILLPLTIALILYALIWPIAVLGFGVWTFRSNLAGAAQNLATGEFDKSLVQVRQAKRGVEEIATILAGFEPIRQISLFKGIFRSADNSLELAQIAQTSAESTVLGVQSLYLGLKAVTGEISDSPVAAFGQAQVELSHADNGLSKAEAKVSDPDFQNTIPPFFKGQMKGLKDKLATYQDLVKKARASAILLPEIVAIEGNKSYLVLLQNNNELRPTGGFIGSYAKISFEAGKLKKLEVNDVYALDGQLKTHVEPPKEIREDLGQKDWYLRDANWEPDFPTSAKQIEWFYNQEAGERVEGVIALDISAIRDLLEVVGPLDLADYNVRIDENNLFEQSITHAEQGFFPGSQAKKTFLTALTNQLFNKVFFLPRQNWPAIVQALGKALEHKHVSVYLDDPKLFSYLVSQNWTGALPRVASQTDQTTDFLAPIEANLGANKANYYLDRSYRLDTTIGKEGEIFQRLKISYTNRSPSNAWPAGVYKNRLRLYLPLGSKLTRAAWAEADISKDVQNFVDYGRTGLSWLLVLAPKQQKTLIVDYQLPANLIFKNNVATYRLDVFKPAGTLTDPFEWHITYPINYRVLSQQVQKIGPQEQVIQTDLSQDRSFEISFAKSL